MLFDVNVSRIQTATRTIRVEAENLEQAEEKALEEAGDTDFGGCVTDYDFETNGGTEVEEPFGGSHAPDCPYRMGGECLCWRSDPEQNPELREELKNTPETCPLCGAVMPDTIEQAIQEGWSPQFFDGDDYAPYGPVCDDCTAKYLRMDEDGELELKPVVGDYVTKWQTGQEFHSACDVNMVTHEIVITETHDVDESVDGREEEYVVIDGKRYECRFIEDRRDYPKDEQKSMFWWK